MGIFDQLFGSEKRPPPTPWQNEATSDEQAIERYRYMLKTAPPETIEQAHAEAFAKLTPEQRRMVGERLSAEVPEAERVAVMQDAATPGSLARAATRAEVRNPGTMERTFGRLGGSGLGGMVAGTFLGSMAGAVIGSMIAQQFFGGHAPMGAGADATESATGNDADTATYVGPGEQPPATLGDDIGSGDIGSVDIGGTDLWDV